MKASSTFFFVTICLFGLIQALWDYQFQSELSQAAEEFARVSGQVTGYSGEDIVKQATYTEQLARTAVSFGVLSSAASVISAQSAKLLYDLTASTEKLCNAESLLTAALRRTPALPEAYVLLVEIYAALKNPELCSESKNSLRIPSLLQQLNSIAPADTALLYRAGIAAVSTGAEAEGLKLLSRAQSLDPSFSSEQEEFLFEIVRNREELVAALPKVYPVIGNWVRFFSAQRRYDYLLWQQYFIDAVASALSNLDERFLAGRIQTDQLSNYVKDIALLPTTLHDDALRRRLDIILDRMYHLEGAELWGDFIRTRSSLQRVPVLKSLPVDDRDARSQQLFGWMPDNAPALQDYDKLGTAIGLFVPDRWFPSYIVLQALPEGRIEKNIPLQLWVSDDNRHYYPLPLENRVQQLTVDGSEKVLISLKGVSGAFLKLRYMGSNQVAQFTNEYARLVEVYGVSNDS